MNPEFRVTDNFCRIHFNDWQSFVDFSAQPPSEVWKCGEHTSRKVASGGYDCGEDWFGTKTYEEAIELARYGWKDGIALADKLTSAMFNRVSRSIKKRRPMLDVQGMGFDVGTYLSGQPECWVRYDHVSVRKVIRILVPTSVSGAVDSDVIKARGATIASLIQLLEFSGYGVELISAPRFNFCGPSRKAIAYGTVLVKSALQKLDMGRVMLACAHPAMNRRLGFNLIEHSPEAFQDSGYGRPIDTVTKELAEGADIVFSGMLRDVQWSNPDAARTWIMEQLRAQGVELN